MWNLVDPPYTFSHCNDHFRRRKLIYSQNQDRRVGRSGSGSPHPHNRPLPPASGPNNEEIYDHPCGLLALFPWETTRSSCTDLQECPDSWEPYWWETDNPLCTALVHMKPQGKRFKTRVMRGQQGPSKGFCRLFQNTVIVNGVYLREWIRGQVKALGDTL